MNMLNVLCLKFVSVCFYNVEYVNIVVSNVEGFVQKLKLLIK